MAVERPSVERRTAGAMPVPQGGAAAAESELTSYGADVTGFDDPEPEDERPLAQRQVALIDLLDRLLTGGAVLTGDLVLSIADVDLVHINLRAVIKSVTGDEPAPW